MSHGEFLASCQVGRTYSVIIHMFGRLTDVWPIKANLFALFILSIARNNVVYDICRAMHSTMW
jgi:hypothetical protein